MRGLLYREEGGNSFTVVERHGRKRWMDEYPTGEKNYNEVSYLPVSHLLMNYLHNI